MEAKPATTKDPRKRRFKARLPNIYRSDNYMVSYNFCQQCKDHFATAKAKKLNHILFGVFFLKDRTNFRCQEHKQKLNNETLVPPTWEKFKTFLCKNLSNLRTFVDSFYRQIKQDAQYQ